MNYYGVLTNEASELELKNRDLTREIAREGFVLLKNEGVLPIENKKIALYGVGARKTVKGGTGSGSVNERYSVSIEEGLMNAGYEILTKNIIDEFDALYNNAYQEWRDVVEEKLGGRSIMECIGLIVGTPFEYPAFPKFTEKADTDTAIYVLTRQAGEGNDRRVKEGDYLLTASEKEMISSLREAYSKLILVVNIGGFADISEVEDKVDSVVFFAQGGEEGGNALADVLSGKYSFSGKLTNTWAKDYYDYPNADTFGYINGDLDNENYTEGIYVGYRYFDSFNKKVLYPFGFGLSYTNFAKEVKSVSVERTKVNIRVDITNVGNKYPGKEVIQVYVSCPNGKLDKEYQRLVAFGKTKELKVSEKETLNLSFDLTSLTSYDEETASWILEQGEYVIRVGNSSRDTKAVRVLDLADTIVTEKSINCCVPTADLSGFDKPIIMDNENKNYEVERINVDISDLNTKINDYTEPSVVETAQEKAILDSLSKEEMAELLRGGDLRNSRQGHITLGAGGKTVLTLEEKGIGNITMSDGPAGLNICKHLKRSSESGTELPIAIPERFNWGNTAKEYAGMAEKTNGKEVYRYATAWPVGIVLAQTWNTEFATKFGNGLGEELKSFGITLWLAPGMNINRNPLCGRVFEYFSEDPVISGEFAKYITIGTQKHKGVGTTVKHFACNNQEDNRIGVSANVSERALREIYLKGFEIAVKDSQPLSIMSSYNKINGIYAPNNHDLLTKIARCEWGFKGLIMTDWHSCNEGQGRPELGAVTGNDLIMPGVEYDRSKILEAVNKGDISDEILRTSACRVLRVILNGISNIKYNN